MQLTPPIRADMTFIRTKDKTFVCDHSGKTGFDPPNGCWPVRRCLKAEWNFVATSHGNNTYDGVDGRVKTESAKESLKAITTCHILTPMDLLQRAVLKIKNVDFYYISKEEVTDRSVPECSYSKCLQTPIQSPK